MSLRSRDKRKTIPPAVGSRTISWMTGFFLKTVSLNLSMADGLYCLGSASGTLRLLPFRVTVVLFAGWLFGRCCVGLCWFLGVSMVIIRGIVGT